MLPFVQKLSAGFFASEHRNFDAICFFAARRFFSVPFTIGQGRGSRRGEV
jgi:hypothetical protein